MNTTGKVLAVVGVTVLLGGGAYAIYSLSKAKKPPTDGDGGGKSPAEIEAQKKLDALNLQQSGGGNGRNSGGRGTGGNGGGGSATGAILGGIFNKLLASDILDNLFKRKPKGSGDGGNNSSGSGSGSNGGGYGNSDDDDYFGGGGSGDGITYDDDYYQYEYDNPYITDDY